MAGEVPDQRKKARSHSFELLRSYRSAESATVLAAQSLESTLGERKAYFRLNPWPIYLTKLFKPFTLRIRSDVPPD